METEKFFFNEENSVCYYDGTDIHTSDLTDRFIKIVDNLCIDQKGKLYELDFYNKIVCRKVNFLKQKQKIIDILRFDYQSFAIDNHINLYLVTWCGLKKISNLKNVKNIKHIYHCNYCTFIHCDNELHIVGLINKTVKNVSNVKLYPSHFEYTSTDSLRTKHYCVRYISISYQEHIIIQAFLIVALLLSALLLLSVIHFNIFVCARVAAFLLPIIFPTIFISTVNILCTVVEYIDHRKKIIDIQEDVFYDSQDVKPVNDTIALYNGSVLHLKTVITPIPTKSSRFGTIKC